MTKTLQEYDIILPIKTKTDGKKLRDIFRDSSSDELKYALKKIKLLYPSMEAAIDQYLDQTYIHACNMFIAKKAIIDDYCCWLFDFLFKLEQDFVEMGEKYHLPRIYGYISEIFFDLWLRFRGYNRIYELGRQSSRHNIFISIFRKIFRIKVNN